MATNERGDSGTLPSLTSARLAVPRLEIVVEREAGAGTSRTLTVDGDYVRLGSHASNDVVLVDPRVSRFHASLSLVGASWRIHDTGSTNGTRVDGVRLRDGDLGFPISRLEMGDSVITVRARESVKDDELPRTPGFGCIVGASLPMRRLFSLLARIAPTDTDVLVEGESGTGKELIASELVHHSERAKKPLVVVDCGAVSPSLIESELFGHLRGSFTGAHRDRAGAFELADGGTIFLDEIGELPLELQPKLLRALANREVRRVGDDRVRKIDVRVIAATNRTLEREVNAGRFREDLYYRLSVVTVRIPPLRDRAEDLDVLLDVFLGELGHTASRPLFTERMDWIRSHAWPGNVRELRNFVERMVVLDGALEMAGAGGATAGSVPPEVPETPIDLDVSFRDAKEAVITAFERRYLGQLLASTGGNVSQAARRAGIDRMHLHRLVQRHGLR